MSASFRHSYLLILRLLYLYLLSFTRVVTRLPPRPAICTHHTTYHVSEVCYDHLTVDDYKSTMTSLAVNIWFYNFDSPASRMPISRPLYLVPPPTTYTHLGILDLFLDLFLTMEWLTIITVSRWPMIYWPTTCFWFLFLRVRTRFLHHHICSLFRLVGAWESRPGLDEVASQAVLVHFGCWLSIAFSLNDYFFWSLSLLSYDCVLLA
jgi:hypothetical protein